MLCIKRIEKASEFLRSVTYGYYSLRWKKVIDKTLVPKLNEIDLVEKFIKGSGPGGQSVNKTVNCVYLLHKPSGLSVKVHESRLQQRNRAIAREKLIMMLDDLVNKEKSVSNQKKEIGEEKLKKKTQRQRKLQALKTEWKKTMAEYINKEI